MCGHMGTDEGKSSRLTQVSLSRRGIVSKNPNFSSQSGHESVPAHQCGKPKREEQWEEAEEVKGDLKEYKN